jgi:murein L,D-transpeptidase YcbB/YkuD
MERWQTPRCVVLLLLGLFAVSATPARAEPPSNALLAPVLQTVLLEDRHPYFAALEIGRHRADLERLYEARNFEPLWSRTRVVTPQAIDAINQLRAAENVGLHAAEYDANGLFYFLVDLVTTRSAGDDQWALFDIGLTTALLAYARDVHSGRVDPRVAGLDLTVEPARLDLPPLVEELSTSHDVAGVLRGLEPPFKHYQYLKRALVHYRELAQVPGLTRLPPLPARSVKPGETYSGTAQLRALLVALGDLPEPPNGGAAPPGGDSLDSPLVEALQRFQSRHGLDVDGALGRDTYAALTTPLGVRVAQIERTLERWRWLPPRVDSPPIIVNIPQFRLFAFHTPEDTEKELLAMNVIVGKAFPANRTPVFVSDMTYLVLRPYWDVPYSITTREMLPSLRTNAGYLAAHGLEMVRGGGDAATVVAPTPENIEALARGTLRLRQVPGPNNALGLAKFIMPNPFNVYLHSTPAQSLFGRSSRAFSHGCVRVADALALAQYVLRDEPTWTRENIVAAMNGTRPLRIDLRTPIRVFIVYGTAVARENGSVLFFEDVYGHDASLQRLLEVTRSRKRPAE